MKFRLLPTLLCAFALSLSACDSNSNNGTAENETDNSDILLGTGNMQATINGSQWDALNAAANTVTGAGVASLIISGTTANADTLTIAFEGVVTTRTYSLGVAQLTRMSFTFGSTLSQTYQATSGLVTIVTINDDEVAGKFSFEARDLLTGMAVSVTGGSFEVDFAVNTGG